MYVEAYVRVCIRGKKRKRNAVSTSVSRRVKWDSMDTAPPRHRRLYGLVCLALFHSSDDRLQSTKLMHMCMSPRVFISREVFFLFVFFLACHFSFHLSLRLSSPLTSYSDFFFHSSFASPFRRRKRKTKRGEKRKIRKNKSPKRKQGPHLRAK